MIKTKTDIKGIEPLQKYFFNSCFYSSLFPIVEYYGRNVIPFMVNGIGTYMFYNTIERCSVYIRFCQERQVSEVFDEIGLGCMKYDICDDVCNVIIEHVSVGRPVIIVADCFFETIRSEMYLKNHLPHYLLIYGYDIDKKVFHIIEQNNVDDIRYDKKEILMDDVDKAYRSFVNLYYKENIGTVWAVYSKEENYNFDKEKYLKTYINNLNLSAERLYAGQVELEAFYERFSIIICDNNTFLHYAKDIINGINDIIKYFNAKRLQFSYIYEEESSYMKYFEKIYQRWSVIRTIISKGFFAGALSQDKKDKIIQNLDAIIYENREFIDILINQRSESEGSKT